MLHLQQMVIMVIEDNDVTEVICRYLNLYLDSILTQFLIFNATQ